MTKESIFTNKLFALLNRTSIANRDIYDIYFFFKQNINFDIDLLEQKV
jgi:predicted nucleotidyltransferase component of viral defense system